MVGVTMPDPPVARQADPILSGVTVIQPGQSRRAHATLVISDGKIASITSAAADRVNSRYAGSYVLPGLVDVHTHLPPHNVLNLIPYFCLLHLAHGVTGVRDAGDADGTAMPAFRAARAERRYPLPRLFACGPFIGGAPPRWDNTSIVETPEQASAAVRRAAREGSDCIKSYDGLTRESVRAVQQTATGLGLPVMGHVPTELAYEEALIPDTQHFLGVPKPSSIREDRILNRIADWQDVDDRRMAEIVDVSLQYGIANTPTLVVNEGVLAYRDYERAAKASAARLLPRMYTEGVWHPQRGNRMYRGLTPKYLNRLADAYEKKRELVARLHQAGAVLRLGTDTQQPFSVPGASLHREMRLFEQCGLRAEEVWAVAATGAGAMGQHQLGRAEEGAPADLVIYSEDPTSDLDALDTMEAVVAGGVLYQRKDLDDAVARCREHFERWTVDRVSVFAARRRMNEPIRRP